jgi:hypothetical protein
MAPFPPRPLLSFTDASPLKGSVRCSSSASSNSPTQPKREQVLTQFFHSRFLRLLLRMLETFSCHQFLPPPLRATPSFLQSRLRGPLHAWYTCGLISQISCIVESRWEFDMVSYCDFGHRRRRSCSSLKASLLLCYLQVPPLKNQRRDASSLYF